MFRWNSREWYLVYQPQYLKRHVVGYEALLRTTGNVDTFPRELFYSLELEDQQALTLQIAREVVSQQLSEPTLPVSFNVAPSIINEAFVRELIKITEPCEKYKIRVEIVEDEPLSEEHKPLISLMHTHGIGIVIDDLPAKHSVHNLQIVDSLCIPIILKFETTVSTPDQINHYRTTDRYTIIQEGEKADLLSGDIVQTRKGI